MALSMSLHFDTVNDDTPHDVSLNRWLCRPYMTGLIEVETLFIFPEFLDYYRSNRFRQACRLSSLQP